MKGPLLSDFTLKRSTFEEFHIKPKKRSTYVSVIIKLLRNSTLNQKKRSTFVGFHSEKRFTFEKFYTKPIKRSTFVGFHAKKRPLLRNFALNQKKRSTFVGFHAIKGPLLRNFSLNQNKRSTFVRFHTKRRSTFEEFYAKPKRSTFGEFYPKPKKGPLLSDFMLKKGPHLRNSSLNQ